MKKHLWWFHFGWFDYWYWHYLLETPRSWKKFWCRAKNHPEGPIYFNVNGTEPDWRCKNCGDYLG